MDDESISRAEALVLDGNAVAGLLNEVFGSELTASPTVCAHCGRRGEVGTLVAYTRGPGIVLRCPGCSGVMVRVVRTTDALYLDARGAVYLRLRRETDGA